MTMNDKAIFHKLVDEHNHIEYEIRKIDRQIAELQAKRAVYEDTRMMLFSVLSDYGDWIYKGYKPMFRLLPEDAERLANIPTETEGEDNARNDV